MQSERFNAVLPTTLKRALRSHCRRRGLLRRRVLAAIVLDYLRRDPRQKLRILTDYHDWRVESTIRQGWKAQQRRVESVGEGMAADGGKAPWTER